MPDPKLYIEVLNDGTSDLYIRDAEAQEEIAQIKETIKNGASYIGKFTSAVVGGETVTMLKDGDVVTSITTSKGTFVPGTPASGQYKLNEGDFTEIQGISGKPSVEFMWNGVSMDEFGSTSVLKSLAFKDSATGSVTAAGSNAPSAVTFTGGTDGDFVTGFDTNPVLPSFTEGQFSAGSLPSFTEGAFTPAEIQTGFATPGAAAQLKSGFYSEGSAPSFTEGQFTPAAIQEGFVSAGSAASFTEGAFSAGTLPSMTYDENTRKLTFSAGTLPSKASDTFVANTPTAIDTSKFSGGSKANDTFSAGSVTTLDLTKFDGGIPTAIDVTKFDGGSKASDSFSAGSLPSKEADTWSAGTAPTLSTGKAVTNIGTGEAAAQTFTGSAVSVTVS